MEFLLHNVKKECPIAEVVRINPRNLIFEENAKMNCFYCGKYGNNWKCPPNLPDINYEKMFSEFDEGMFIVLKYAVFDFKQYEEIRAESSVVLHKLLLKCERWLWESNKSTSLSFGGGSCKLCKGGCGKDRCNNPYLARSPIEAIGINVIKSAAQYGIEIKFPPKDELKRIGLIVWQNMEV